MNFVTAADIRNPRQSRVYAILYIACIAVAGLSDWPALPDSAMYLKVFSLGGFLLAILRMLWKSDFSKLKLIGKMLLLFIAPLLFVYLLSMGLWSTKTMDMAYISRGTQKIVFQFITVAVVAGASYLFGSRAIDYTFYGLVVANAVIMAGSMVSYGVGRALLSMLDSINVMSNASGFLYTIEIHDITFCMGLFALYYMFERRMVRRQWLHIAVSAFFFIIGFKRIAILAVAVAFLLSFLLKRVKKRRVGALLCVLGVMMILISFGYVYIITKGYWSEFFKARGVDMAGRDRIYKYIAKFYTIGPEFTGYGYEYTVALLRGMRDSGEQIIHVTGIHCDILKQYIELGFWGYIVWIAYTFVFQSLWYYRQFGSHTAILFFVTIAYAWVTYMTDNTIYYFWLSICLKMVMISYVFKQVEALDRGERTTKSVFDFRIGDVREGAI